jgi:hypothetical protein
MESHRVLQWTYVVGFYLPVGAPEKPLFEEQQVGHT